MNDIKALYKEIYKLFGEAEKKVKLVERLGEGVSFPAVNQLRYVGFHLLRASKEIKEKIICDELTEAKYHCQRAIYDGSEAAIIFYLENIRIFKNDYALVTVTGVLNDYIEILKRAEEANSLILTRTNNSVGEHCNIDSNDSGVLHFRQADEICEGLEKDLLKLDLSRQELNKIVDQARMKYLFSFWTIILMLFSILVVLVLN